MSTFNIHKAEILRGRACRLRTLAGSSRFAGVGDSLRRLAEMLDRLAGKFVSKRD